jgi:glucosamine-6-phosphate deaminase
MATYAELGRRGLDVSQVRIWLLDEYVGLPPDDPRSYRRTVVDVLGHHLGVEADQVRGPDATDDDPDALLAATRRYDDAIAAAGGIDLQLLGIGRNGHIGFNEPGSGFDLPTRVVELADSTRRDNARFFASPDDVPRRAITQGIGTILRARRLVLIATGSAKAPALHAALDGPIDPTIPASALRLHPDAIVIADPDAAAQLDRR